MANILESIKNTKN